MGSNLKQSFGIRDSQARQCSHPLFASYVHMLSLSSCSAWVCLGIFGGSHGSFLGVQVPPSSKHFGVYSGWFPLMGLPWTPPCPGLKCSTPCQPLRHQFPSSSIGDEFKQKLTDLITQASKAFLLLHKTDLPLVTMPT